MRAKRTREIIRCHVIVWCQQKEGKWHYVAIRVENAKKFSSNKKYSKECKTLIMNSIVSHSFDILVILF